MPRKPVNHTPVLEQMRISRELRRMANQLDQGIVPSLAFVAEKPTEGSVAAMSSEDLVDTEDLHRVIILWGQKVVTKLTATPVLPPPVVVPPPVTPPTQVASPSIKLGNGSTTVADKAITGDTGIVADNATSVDTLIVSNVSINSINYGIYLGSCKHLQCTGVRIKCSPTGGDSYSVRGTIERFDSSDSVFESGIKAFRIYGCLGGHSLRDEIRGDRLMLGGGYANEWVSPGPFTNFLFENGKIDVNSVEIYDATHHVTFDGMDFKGTGHISIQFQAHHITFKSCSNFPEIKFFDGSGNRYYPTASQLAARNIVLG